MLKLIGCWIASVGDQDLPAPQELVGELPGEVRKALVSYLATGLPLVQYRGLSWCRFHCGIESRRMGSWDLTDGVWVWPEGLAHYVEVHGVILPDEFVRHALSAPSRTKPDTAEKYDFDYWIRWCAPRRLPAVVQGLREALIAAQPQIAALRAERIARLEQKQGLSTERCTWNGCPRSALTGVLVCAGHSLTEYEMSGREVLFSALLEYLRQLPNGTTPSS